MARIRLAIYVDFELENGNEPSSSEVAVAQDSLKEAIARAMLEQYLPDEFVVEDYRLLENF